jgi:hypothetical protein
MPAASAAPALAAAAPAEEEEIAAEVRWSFRTLCVYLAILLTLLYAETERKNHLHPSP